LEFSASFWSLGLALRLTEEGGALLGVSAAAPLTTMEARLGVTRVGLPDFGRILTEAVSTEEESMPAEEMLVTQYVARRMC